MIAPVCGHENHKKAGKNRNGSQRYKCKDCGATFSDEYVPTGPFGTMRVDTDKAVLALDLLLEGMSVRAVSRMTNLDQKTISKLILLAGERCERFTRSVVVDVQVDCVEADETWSFIGAKSKT